MRRALVALFLLIASTAHADWFGAENGFFTFGNQAAQTDVLGSSFNAEFNGVLSESHGTALTFTRATVAYNPESGASTASGSPRYVTGRSGQAIFIEEGTTNAFANSASPVTQDIAVTTANSGKWTCSVIGAGTVTSSAGTATASGYGAATAGTPNTITVTVNGTVTYTVTGADATTRVQVENKAYATSYQDSANATRNGETLTFNPTGIITPTQGTISAWVYVATGSVWRSTSTRVFLFGTSSSGNNNRINLETNSGNIIATTYNSSGTSSEHAVAVTLPVGWSMLSMTWNNTELALWINGVKQASPVASPNIPSAVGTVFHIGATKDGTLQANTQIDNLRIYNRVLSASELLNLYRSGK